MLTRRQSIARGLAAGSVLVIPTAALSQQPHANPMPPELRQALEREANAPVLGNPNGDITLVEFFDYNCQWCRKLVDDIPHYIESDPNLRIVFREWPVFGEGSFYAAQVALASLPQGKYWQTHHALMKIRGRAEPASVDRVIRQVGLDEARLREDMQGQAVSSHLLHSHELADSMGLAGTPTFIAGHEAHFGDISRSDMREFIAQARRDLGV
ncbi:MAG: DsbA family protein [Paracoccus sp. (in: a-proteobacteria)]|nr:DsbA family protein [Paracoccus sp. (in: a-proteobacteria)]